MDAMHGELLSYRPKPLPDELFSSWLIRVAHAQGLKLQTFCHMMWPEAMIWNRDCDRCANPELLSSLADMTGVAITQANATLLTSYEGILFRKAVKNGHTKWILPLGVFHRFRRRNGLQYCPQCLADATPYFRRVWRLSLFTLCERHQCLLRDECPHCKRPVHPHRGEMGDRKRTAPLGNEFCWMCGGDLRDVATGKSIPQPLLSLQTYHSSLLKRDLGVSSSDSCLYFDCLAHILQLVTSRRSRMARFRELMSQASGIEITSIEPKGSCPQHFDAFSTNERAQILHAVAWMFEDWPGRFRALIILGKLRCSDLSGEHIRLPEWFSSAIRRPMRYKTNLLPGHRPFRGNPQSVEYEDGFEPSEFLRLKLGSGSRGENADTCRLSARGVSLGK